MFCKARGWYDILKHTQSPSFTPRSALSIKLRLSIALLFFSILPVFIVALLTFNNARETLIKTRTAQLESIAKLKVEKLQQFFTDKVADARIAREFRDIKSNLPIIIKYSGDTTSKSYLAAENRLDAQIKDFMNVRGYADVMLVSPSGKIVYSANRKHRMADLGHFLPDPAGVAFAKGMHGLYLSDVFRNPVEHEKLGMLATAPINDFNHNFIGVLALEIDMDKVYAFIEDTTGLGDTGETLIGKKEGDSALFLNPLRHDPGAALKKTVAFGSATALPMQEAVQGRDGAGVRRDYRDEEVIAAWRHVPFLDWGLVAKIDTAEAFAYIRHLRNYVIATVFIVTILVILTAMYIARSILNPLDRLQEGIRVISGGNFDYKVGTGSDDEVGRLSRAFDAMTARLKVITASRDDLNREIEERKRADAELRKLTVAVEQNPAEIIITDLEGNIEYVNPKFTETTGYTEDEVIGQNPRILKSGYQSKEFYDELWSTVKSGGVWRGDFMNKKKDGELYWEAASIRPIMDENGVAEHLLAIKLDITDRKRDEEALRESEERLRFHAENSPLAIIEWDSDFVVTRWAGEAEKIFGWSAEETVGKPIMGLKMIYEEDLPIVHKTMEKLSDGVSRKVVSQNRNYTKDGRVIYCEWYNSVLQDENGNMASVMSEVLDVTDRKNAEKRLNDLLEELQRSNAELEQFAYVASHDLQEPLRVIAGYVQLLSKRYQGRLDDKADSYINYVVDGANRMQVLIRDLLAYSRVGAHTADFSSVDTEAILSNALAALRVALDEAGAEVTHGALPTVRGDTALLEHLFINLVGNAVKYRGEDPPRVHVAAERKKDEWVFSVKDNGIGIDPKYSERIFTIFQRLHGKGKYTGTGIGLAICKKAVEKHGGRIWVESEPGAGATFFFTIPKERS